MILENDVVVFSRGLFWGNNKGMCVCVQIRLWLSLE
jgi:hypothetical protein